MLALPFRVCQGTLVGLRPARGRSSQRAVPATWEGEAYSGDFDRGTRRPCLFRFMPFPSGPVLRFQCDMGTSRISVRLGRLPAGSAEESGGGAPLARQVFVDERGVRRRLIRAGERALAVAAAAVLAMGFGGMVGAPWVPHLDLPLIGAVGPSGPAAKPEAPQAGPDPALSPERAQGAERAPKPVPAPTPGPQVPTLTVAQVSRTTDAPGPASAPPVTSPSTSTAPTSPPASPASPASGGSTTQPSPDPSPSPAPQPSDHGQALAAAHSQSKADPSPGPRSAKAK